MSRFTYTIVNDTITDVTDTGSGTNEAIIPDSVTAILKTGSGAFQSFGSLHAFTSSSSSLLDSIGFNTFCQCPNLTRVTLGTTVLTTIESQAFYQCTNLTELNFPSSLKYINYNAFYDCSKLTSASISSVTYINYSAFQGCTGLTSLIFGEGLLYMGDYCFSGCSGLSNLSNLTIPDSVTFLGGETFNGSNIKSITYRSNLKSVYSIVYNTGVTSVTISSASTVLPIYFINNFTNIYSLTIPSGIKRYEQSCFEGCTNLTSINIPQGVTYIGPTAFYNVPITEIYIPDSVTNLDGFNTCPNLKTVTTPFPAASNPLYNVFQTTLITSLTLLPSNTVLKDNEIRNFQNITSLIIPSNVTGIGSTAFLNCISLTHLTIPEGVKYFGAQVFWDCTSLTSFTFPNSLTSVGSQCFYNCASLKELINLNTDIITTGTHSIPYNIITNVTLKEGLTILQNLGYPYSYSALKSLTIPTSITVAGGNALHGCVSLTSTINLPNVLDIQDSAFQSCSLVPLITYPAVNIIRNYAFTECSSLTEIIMPSTITSIGGVGVWRNCSSLRKLTTNSKTAVFSSSYSEGTNPCVYITEVTISADSTVVANGVFDTFTSLLSLSMPTGISYIGQSSFNNCSSLTAVNGLSNTSVTYIGSYAFDNCSSLKVLALPDTVTDIAVNGSTQDAFRGTTAIQNFTFKTGFFTLQNWGSHMTSVTISPTSTFLSVNTFHGCSSLTSVTVPNSVTGADSGIFTNCTGLTSITMSTGLHYYNNSFFYGTSSLRSINIPNTVTNLGGNCFQNSGLRIVNIPSSVTTVGGNCFHNCTSLTSLTIGGSPTIGDYAFTNDSYIFLNIPIFSYNTSLISYNTVQNFINVNYVLNFMPLEGSTTMPAFPNVTSISLPESTTVVDTALFQNNTSVLTVELPNSVVTIDDGAFQGCSSITYIEIPPSLEVLGNNSFKDCSSLTSISIPNTVTTLGSSAFQNCTSLSTVTIPTSITQLESNTFNGCTSLTVAELPNAITTIDTGAFRNCSSMTSVAMNGTSLSIGSYAFANCSDLQTVTISNIMFTPSLFSSLRGMLRFPGGTSIGDYAFQNDVSLNSYAIPITTTLIGIYAFDGCTSLSGITIPVNVETVSPYAFNGCTALGSVTVDGPGTFTDLSANSFNGCVNVSGGSKVGLLNKGYTQQELLDAGFTNIPIICFNENTKISCLVNGVEKEVLVQHIRKGFLVKTSLNGYKPVDMIGTSKMFNPGNNERILERLYVCSKDKYPELTEDLIITGCHAILVDNLTQKQREETIKEFGRVFATDKKYRLIAKLDERSKPYNHVGQHNIYHIALENENYYSNYGIFANGLLVESCSKRYLKELSKMTLL